MTPPHPFVVGICGLAGAGKTTFANAIKDRLKTDHAMNAEIVPFAKPLKDGLAAMGIRKDESPDLYRVAAQQLGTNVVRHLQPNFWCDRFRETVESTRRCTLVNSSTGEPVQCDDPIEQSSADPCGYRTINRDVIIADDVRFKNEVETIRDLGGIVLYVDAADRLGLVHYNWLTRRFRIKPFGIYKHESERLALDAARSILHECEGLPARYIAHVLRTKRWDFRENWTDLHALKWAYDNCEQVTTRIARLARMHRRLGLKRAGANAFA